MKPGLTVRKGRVPMAALPVLPPSTWASVPHGKLAQGPVGATCPWEMGLEMESLCTGICSIIRREAVFMGGWSGGLTHGILGSTRIWKV